MGETPFEHINKTYNVSAKKGGRIFFKYYKKYGIITGVHAANLKVKFDDGTTGNLHPTWEIEYLETEGGNERN
jgi:hypothetical protein